MAIDDPHLRSQLSLDPLPDDGTADVGSADLLPSVQSGDNQASKALVRQYLRVVVWSARNSGSLNSKGDYLYLVHAGNHGVLSAAKQFQPSMGLDFPSYVRWWICHSIEVAREKDLAESRSRTQ